MTDSAPLPVELGGERLRAVAEIWKRRGGEVVTRFGGTSMRPTIEPGGEVVLRFGQMAEVGDIIAYVAGERLLVHRVAARSESRRWILTRGDAHALPDLPILDPASVLGVIVRVRHGDELVPPPGAPRSFAGPLLLSVCVLALGAGPRAGRLTVTALTLLRRWFLAVPRVHAARLRNRVRSYFGADWKRPTAP